MKYIYIYIYIYVFHIYLYDVARVNARCVRRPFNATKLLAGIVHTTCQNLEGVALKLPICASLVHREFVRIGLGDWDLE